MRGLLSFIALLAVGSLPVVQSAACATQANVDRCLSSASLLQGGCGPSDTKCLCTAYTAIWGCYNSCPTSSDALSAQQTMLSACKASSNANTADSGDSGSAATTKKPTGTGTATVTATTIVTEVTSVSTTTAAPTSTSTADSSSSDSSSSDSSKSSSKPASNTAIAVGAAVGIALGFLLLGGLSFFFWRRRAMRAQGNAIEISSIDYSRKPEIDGTELHVKPPAAAHYELSGNHHFVAELPADSKPRPPVELHGSGAHWK